MDLRTEISRIIGINNLNDSELLLRFEDLLLIEGQRFNNHLNDIILYSYYNSFLNDVYLKIYDAVTALNPVNSKEAERLRSEANKADYAAKSRAFKNALCDFNDSRIINKLSGCLNNMTNELSKILKRKNVFEVAKYDDYSPSINISPEFWQLYAENVSRRICSLREKLLKDIPDFDDVYPFYLYHCALYNILSDDMEKEKRIER